MVWLSSAQCAVGGTGTRPLDALVTKCKSRHLRVAQVLLKNGMGLSPVEHAEDGMLIVLLDGCQNANVNRGRNWLHQGLVLIINSVKESSDMRSLRPRPVAQDWFRAFRSMTQLSSAHGAVDGILTCSLDARVTRS